MEEGFASEGYRDAGRPLESVVPLYVGSLQSGEADYASRSIRNLVGDRIGDSLFAARLRPYLSRMETDEAFRGNEETAMHHRSIITTVLNAEVQRGQFEPIQAAAYRAAKTVGFEGPYRIKTQRLAEDITGPLRADALGFVDGQIEHREFGDGGELYIRAIEKRVSEHWQGQMAEAVEYLRGGLGGVEQMQKLGKEMQEVLQRLEDIRRKHVSKSGRQAA